MASSINADNGVISGSSGLKSTADASGVLALQTNGTTAVTINTNGNLLVGTTTANFASSGRGIVEVNGSTGAILGLKVGDVTKGFFYNDGTNATLSNQASGTLAFQTGGTTQLQIGASGQLGIGGATYGTSGQVLTSGGSGAAPSWSTLTVSGSGGTTATGNVTLTSASSGAQSITPANYGSYVKLPDATTMTKAALNFSLYNAGEYPIKILDYGSNNLGFIYPKTTANVGCADTSTSNGIWVVAGVEPVAETFRYTNTTLKWGTYALGTCFALDNDRQFITFNDVTANSIYAVVYDSNTGTFGSATLIDTAGTVYGSAAVLVSSNTVLIGYVKTTTTNGRVLTISGTTITVNAAGTAAGAAPTAPARFTLIGSTYVMDQGGHVVAFTVSGTTVTVGNAVALTGTYGSTSTGSFAPMYSTLWQVTSSSFARFSQTTNTGVYAQAFSISGVTITAGTLLTLSVGPTYQNDYYAFVCGSQWALCYCGTSDRPTVSIISISGTTCTASTVATSGTNALSTTVTSGLRAMVVGSKVVVASATSFSGGSASFNIVTNTAGTASAGTAYTPAVGSNTFMYFAGLSGNYATFLTTDIANNNKLMGFWTIDCSGSSPTLLRKKYSAVINPAVSSIATILVTPDSFGRNAALLGSRTSALYSLFFNGQYYDTPITRSTGIGVTKINSSYLGDYFDSATGATSAPGVTAYETWNFFGAATQGASSTGVSISKMESSIT